MPIMEKNSLVGHGRFRMRESQKADQGIVEIADRGVLQGQGSLNWSEHTVEGTAP